MKPGRGPGLELLPAGGVGFPVGFSGFPATPADALVAVAFVAVAFVAVAFVAVAFVAVTVAGFFLGFFTGWLPEEGALSSEGAGLGLFFDPGGRPGRFIGVEEAWGVVALDGVAVTWEVVALGRVATMGTEP